jgi:hypothetical protein
MTVHASLSPAQAQRIVPGGPSAFSASAAGRLPPLFPPKSWVWWIEQDGCHIGPRIRGGTAVIGETTNGEGEENGFRDNVSESSRARVDQCGTYDSMAATVADRLAQRGRTGSSALFMAVRVSALLRLGADRGGIGSRRAASALVRSEIRSSDLFAHSSPKVSFSIRRRATSCKTQT